MDRVTRYGKVLAAGASVLVALLASTPGAWATVTPVTTPTDEDFSGTLDINSNSNQIGSSDIIMDFSATDLTNSGDSAVLGNAEVNVSNTFTGATSYDFSGLFNGSIGDQWDVTLSGVSVNGSTVGTLAAGAINFFQGANGNVSIGNEFSFVKGDPVGASNGSSVGVNAVPEIDTSSAATPFALLVGSLLLVSEVRQRRNPT